MVLVVWVCIYKGFSVNIDTLFCSLSTLRIAELVRSAQGSVCEEWPGSQLDLAEPMLETAGGTCLKAQAPMLLARALVFARTGAGIAAVAESVLRSLVRAKQVESSAGQIRVVQPGAGV